MKHEDWQQQMKVAATHVSQGQFAMADDCINDLLQKIRIAQSESVNEWHEEQALGFSLHIAERSKDNEEIAKRAIAVGECHLSRAQYHSYSVACAFAVGGRALIECGKSSTEQGRDLIRKALLWGALSGQSSPLVRGAAEVLESTS